MFSLCRLCAACIDPIDLTMEISELEPKLVQCFGWKASEKEVDMPKKVCNSCVDRLQSSYDFIECMLNAEKQLNKLLSEQVQAIADVFLPQTIEIKIEDEKKRLTDLQSEEFDIFYENVNDSDYEENSHQNDYKNEDGQFGEPSDFSDNESECSNKSSIKKMQKKVDKKKQPLNNPFLAVLDSEDRLDGGCISENGVKKLEQLYPIMKCISWEDCQYKCEKCNRLFTGSLSFYSHIRSVHLKEVLSIVVPCFYCNSKYRREFALKRHIASEHFAHLKYRCPYCPVYFWNTQELIKHRNMHTDVQFTCEICSLKFTSRDNFYAHCASHLMKRKKDPTEEFVCDVCKKQFKTKGSIRNHMLLHTDKFDHVCEQCGWKFQSKGNLKGHLASTHATVKPFKCDKCVKCFKTKHQLQNHSIMHAENYTPHVCSYCAASFRRKSTLKVHIRSHTKFCPYTCKYCGKKFRHAITLQTHVRSHTNDKPYVCTHCEYRCTSKGNLNKHMMRAHSIDFRNQMLKRDTV